MSGTPTTGAKSDVALEQLYKLLQFLRHPRLIGGSGGSGGGSGGNGGSGGSSSVVKSESSESVNSRGSMGGRRKSHTTDADAHSTTSIITSTSSTTTAADSDFLSPDKWLRDVVVPCLAQKDEAWQSVVELLKTVLLRHTKVSAIFVFPVSCLKWVRFFVSCTTDIFVYLVVQSDKNAVQNSRR